MSKGKNEGKEEKMMTDSFFFYTCVSLLWVFTVVGPPIEKKRKNKTKQNKTRNKPKQTRNPCFINIHKYATVKQVSPSTIGQQYRQYSRFLR